MICMYTGGIGGKISCGDFWTHSKIILNMSSYLQIVFHTSWEETTQSTIKFLEMAQSTIKLLEKILTKNWKWRLKLQQNHKSTILYVSIKQSILEIWDIHLYFIRGLTAFMWRRNAFPQFRMAAFQTWIKYVVTWLYLTARIRISKVMRR